MSKELYSGEDPAPGLLLSPPGRQYELLAHLLPAPDDQRHRYLSDSKPSVWTVRDGAGQCDTSVVKLCPSGVMDDSTTLLDGEGAKLWRIAGYAEAQTLPQHMLPSPHLGQAHCVRIVDAFLLEEKGLQGNNGESIWDEEDRPVMLDTALVLERLGPSVERWRLARRSEPFLLSTIKAIVRQVLSALDYLHVVVGVAHCGLTTDNILLQRHYDEAALAADAPAALPLVKLTSFTLSRWISYPDDRDSWHYHPLASGSILTPEHAMMGYRETAGPADAHDIWAVGVLVSILAFNRNLSNVHHVLPKPDLSARTLARHPFLAARTSRISDPEVVNYASLDPEAPWPRYYYRDGDGKGLREWSNKHFPFDVPGVERLPSIRERVEATRALGNDSEVEGVSSFLRACWTIDPEMRPTAAQLLQHEWLQGAV